MNPNKEEDIRRLRKSIEASYRELQPFRDIRRSILKQLVGRNYCKGKGTKESIPLGLLGLAYSVHLHNLVARQPAVLVGTHLRELRPFAEDMRLDLNLIIREINLKSVLREVVASALVGFAEAKVGIWYPDDSPERLGGAPFVQNVDFDNHFHDVSADRWADIGFTGDFHRCLVDDLKDPDGGYNQKMVKQIEGDSYRRSDDLDPEKASDLSRDDNENDEPFLKTVELIDVWVPRDKLVVTLARKPGIDTAVKVIEWEGPPAGPYRRLYFQTVPANLMPLPPAAGWYDQHIQANSLYRKVVRQALRQKQVGGAVAEAAEDGENLIKAADGDVIRLKHGGIQEISLSNPNQAVLAMAITAKSLFGYFAGNIDSIGGLGSQAETLGQEELISASASKSLADMQDQVVDFTDGVVKDLAFWRWTDKFRRDQVVKRIPGVDFGWLVDVGPEHIERAGPMFNYQFEVVPYSMQHRTPAVRLRTLMQMLNGIIYPAMPMIQQQGFELDISRVLKDVADYADAPEIVEWIKMSAQSGGGEMADDRNQHAPAITKRTYERVNRPGRSERSADFALAQTLMGGGVQGAEAANAMNIGG